MNWPAHRPRELTGLLKRLVAATPIRFTFLPSAETEQFKYFPDPALLERDLREYAPAPFAYVPWEAGAAPTVDIVICTAHGSDLSATLWQVRQQAGPEAVLALWLWDNHWAWIQNLRSALAADLLFVSHANPDYVGYLRTPAALLAGHVSACSAQWARGQAGELRACAVGSAREHKALINYVNYGFSWGDRTRILNDYAAGLRDADVFLMPSDDRSRYFSQSALDRFAEWSRYKATVVVPVRDDLSTRVFDALLAGLIPVLPGSIHDLDRIIPPADQSRLGLVMVDSLELAVVQPALAEALRRFDAMGVDGILARQNYVLDNHMLVNRVTEILYHVWQLAVGARTIGLRCEEHGPTLYSAESDAVA